MKKLKNLAHHDPLRPIPPFTCQCWIHLKKPMHHDHNSNYTSPYHIICSRHPISFQYNNTWYCTCLCIKSMCTGFIGCEESKQEAVIWCLANRYLWRLRKACLSFEWFNDYNTKYRVLCMLEPEDTWEGLCKWERWKYFVSITTQTIIRSEE